MKKLIFLRQICFLIACISIMGMGASATNLTPEMIKRNIENAKANWRSLYISLDKALEIASSDEDSSTTKTWRVDLNKNGKAELVEANKYFDGPMNSMTIKIYSSTHSLLFYHDCWWYGAVLFADIDSRFNGAEILVSEPVKSEINEDISEQKVHYDISVFRWDNLSNGYKKATIYRTKNRYPLDEEVSDNKGGKYIRAYLGLKQFDEFVKHWVRRK